MIRSALIAFAATALAPFAHAQEIAGEWTGRYICNQGVTALHLTIRKSAANAITATFNFGPLPENPGVPEGSYQMRGTYDPASRHMKLKGEKWIDAPFGYEMVGLDGRMAATGAAIKGYVPGVFGCTDFEVRRPVELIG